MLHDLTAFLKESATKWERAKTILTAPPFIKELREQRRRKQKPTDDIDKRAKKPTTSTTKVNHLQLQSKAEVPTQNFVTSLRSIETEADHGADADGTTERQQQPAPSIQASMPPPIVLTSQVNLIQLQRQLKGLLKGNFKFRITRNCMRVATE
jgi:hypothetical protein